MKKTLKILVAIALVVISLFSTTISAFAAGNDLATATPISFSTTYNGEISTSNTKDFYKFTISQSGRINIALTAYIERTNYFLYDENGKQLWSVDWQYWNDVSKQYTLSKGFDLTSGTYYFCIEKSSGTGEYNFSVTYSSAGETFKETPNGLNETQADSYSINIGTYYNGQLALNESRDFYKFTISKSGRLNISLTAHIERTDYFIYDKNGKEIWKKDWQYWNDVSKQLFMDVNLDLTSGEYYFCVGKSNGTGNYNFSLNFTDANESFAETTGGINEELLYSTSIDLNKAYNGQLALNETKDFYKFTLQSSQKITLNVTASIKRTDYFIYNSAGKEVWSEDWKYWDDVSHKLIFEKELSLDTGTYYFCVGKSDGTGNYSFSISDGGTVTPPPVTDADLFAVYIYTPPTQRTYTIGESFNKSGLVVKAEYTDGSSAVVNNYTLSGFSSSSAGIKTITVTYTEGGITKKNSFTVTVNEATSTSTLSAISISSKPNKTNYTVGESFDSTGLVVKAIYSDASSRFVENYTLSGFSSSSAGTKYVTVTYVEGNITKQASFTVTVTEDIEPGPGYQEPRPEEPDAPEEPDNGEQESVFTKILSVITSIISWIPTFFVWLMNLIASLINSI